MELTVQNVYGLLLRSKLLGADDAAAMFARWQREADDSSNVARFAAWMVAGHYLTEYQAALLARGHGEGFFLGRYKILDRLGKGRMAGVYKGQHESGQVVAIKVLPPSKARDPGLLGRFRREAKLALRLKHRHVVRTFQVGQAKGLHYLVMEYLEGETLEVVLARRKQLPPGEAVRLIYQALLGLQHIHEQGFVHRDLKPANLMLLPSVGTTTDDTRGCTVKILDIGLGRVAVEDEAPEGLSDPDLTTEGVLLGTPDYMAPEQARDGRSIDIRADVYSLGCVLYHLVAGEPPFPDTNIISQMIRHANEPPKRLATFNPAVADGLQQILNWMMAKNPADRYPTPQRAAQALEMFLASEAPADPSPEADGRLRSFLTWLETEEGHGEEEPEPATVATEPPPVHPTPRTDRKPPVTPSKHKTAKSAPPPLPSRSPPESEPSLLVDDTPEVALPPTTRPAVAEVSSPLQLTRRELVLFGIGAGAGALLAILGCALALSGKRASLGDPSTDP